jgi:CheY-like chemotaxis protein
MRQGRILIIDDDPDITDAMSVVLGNKGYEVLVAHDSDQGRERLKEGKPDLIILDVMMRTSQEGFEFSREIKQDGQFKDIPILMLTGVKEKKGIDFKSAAGDENWLPVEGFLDKPVKPDVLIEKVQDLLSTPKA